MKLNEMFSKLNGKGAFMPYVCCGDGGDDFIVRLIETLVENGADAIEFGIPFSDPIADGKTIQAAASRALDAGMTPHKALAVIRELRKRGITIPITAMTYYNIIFVNGNEKFLKEIKDAGADALIVPDVPLEESESLHRLCEEVDLDLVYLITPNCSDERIKKIAEKGKGFLYAVAVLGITGARDNVAPEALELVKRAKKLTNLPIVVGFGISKPEHAKEVLNAGAAGVIVGSEIVNLYSKALPDEKKALEKITHFTKEIKNALG